MSLQLPNLTTKILDSRFAHISNTKSTLLSTKIQSVLPEAACEEANLEIRQWPAYQKTPLHSLNSLAAASGINQLWYKDEAPRFNLKSFKALGGAYAVSKILLGEIAAKIDVDANSVDLLSRKYSEITQNITVSCATDGNHGRSVAWGAREFGCQCVIYIHATVSDGRKCAIEAFGAHVIRTKSNYDDSVRQAAEDAQKYGRIVVSDTSYDGYMEIPKYVMQGYSVIADEVVEQLADEVWPTHLFLQGGVGGFAAAMIARFQQLMGLRSPRMIIVEPDNAACIFESIRAGEPRRIEGDLDTIMAGLACGEISLLAWEILEAQIQDALLISDQSAEFCMKLLAEGLGSDKLIVAGESAVAGLAGLLCATGEVSVFKKLGLDKDSRVLVIGTEGATDEDIYKQIVGRSAEEVGGIEI